MPIPTKPLREMLREEMASQFDGRATIPDSELEILTDAAMRALHAYDPCFAKAAEQMEPTFTLRAQDETATGRVRDWTNIQTAAKNGHLPGTHDGPTRIPQEKIDEAYAIADAMRAWPERRLPD